MSRLEGMPEELMSNISIKLGSDDIFNFRLTCRSIEHKTFHEFANEYFNSKCFILTTESLKVLVNIATSEKLRGYLHEVYLVPALFSDRVFNCCQGDLCVWKPSTRQTEAWRFYMQDQKNLQKTGRDLEMLTEAFQQLPGLSKLTFKDSVGKLPRDLDLRGYQKAVRSTNNTPAMILSAPDDKEYYRWKKHVWKVLIKALANSGKSTLKDFHVELDQLRNGLAVEHDLNFSSKVMRGLGVTFKNVRAVGLNISSRKNSHPEEDDDGIDTVQAGKAMGNLARLLPALKDLRLTFTHSPSSAALCRSFTNKLKLENMVKLELDRIYLTAKYLAATVTKLVSIEDLQITTINLTQGTWVPVLKAIQKPEKLRHLHLMYLMEDFVPCYFLKPLPKYTPTSPQTGSAIDPGDMGSDDYESEYEYDEDGYPIDGEPMSDDGTDDSMPDLEPHDDRRPDELGDDGEGFDPNGPQGVIDHAVSRPSNDPPIGDASFGLGPDRGGKICLDSRALIEKYIPIFIDEYRLEDEMGDHFDPNHPVNAIMNSLGAAFGAAGPPGMGGLYGVPMPGPGGTIFMAPATGGPGGMMPPPPPPPAQAQAGAGAAAGGPGGQGAPGGAGTAAGNGQGGAGGQGMWW
ncbi:uncharacterized protein LTR77_003686 [Saxophila tyrrhenica]|uniref:F-box domain-containing protein n=1 Tax=Saxophila tyrrhenica TaxID=1690608 RepID=A0AAV9PHU7_9PEZI|nr:hypothetical protein LTR77_003686 [Saxophila tyrrhenica]